MTTKQLLTKTRDLIQNPMNFTQGTDARNRAGTPVSTYSKGACQFCLVGALSKIVSEHSPHNNELYNEARKAIEKQGNTTAIGTFSDENTHETVISTLNKAIDAQSH